MQSKEVSIIGVPLDLGAGRRGVDMGPSAVRVADLNKRLTHLGYKVTDIGNIPVSIPETQEVGDQHCKFLREIVEVCENLAQLVENSLTQGSLPIVLGGDHSIAMGSLAGLAHFYQQQRQNIGLIWFDAHADFNTPETSPSGNIHGMPLSSSLGFGPPELREIFGFQPKIRPQNTVLVGVRDIDTPEKEVLLSSAIRVFTMRDVDERGMRSVVEEAIRIATQLTAGFALSWDMDFIDPAYAPGVGTPIRGGASYREAHLAMEMIADTNKLLMLELVEINPVLDNINTTGNLAVELILSALGKKIL
jgi:arginase